MLSPVSMESTTAQSVIAACHPWAHFFDHLAFNLSVSLSESTARITRNLFYFRVNYAPVTLLILFLSLLWHPISMIVFLVAFVAWFFLYFFRNVPLTLFGYTINDRVVLCRWFGLAVHHPWQNWEGLANPQSASFLQIFSSQMSTLLELYAYLSLMKTVG